MHKQRISDEDFQASVDSKVSDELFQKLKTINGEEFENSTKEIVSSNEIKQPVLKQPHNPDTEKPTETHNTRIPKSLSAMIDDFIYLQKKQGFVETKQSLTIKAITRFLNQT